MITFAPKRPRISDASAMVSEASGPGAGWFRWVVSLTTWTTLGGTGLITKMPLNFQGSKSETSVDENLESWIEFFLFFYINRWIWMILLLYRNIYVYILRVYIYMLCIYPSVFFNVNLFCPVTEVPPCHSWFHGTGAVDFGCSRSGSIRK